MSGPETKVVQAIVEALEARGAVVVVTHGSRYSLAGTPDLLGVLPGGRALALEVKRPGRSDGTTMKQRRELWRWAERGAAAGKVASVSEALSITGFST